MYKSLKCRDYLNVDQLSQQVKIFEQAVNLDISEENLHDSIALYWDILFRYANGRGNVTYFLFGLHYKNSREITGGGQVFQFFNQVSKLVSNWEIYRGSISGFW